MRARTLAFRRMGHGEGAGMACAVVLAERRRWQVFTLRGRSLKELLASPVCHISYFEADAFAHWWARGCRPKRSGKLLLAGLRWKEIFWSRKCCIRRRRRREQVCSNFTAMYGSGPSARIFLIRVIGAPGRARRVQRQIHVNQMVLRGGSAVLRPPTFERPTEISSRLRSAGSFPAFGWPTIDLTGTPFMHVPSSVISLPEAAYTPVGAEVYRGLTATA